MNKRDSQASPAAAGRRLGSLTLGLLWMIAVAPALANPTRISGPDFWRPYATIGVLARVTLEVHWYETKEALREAANERDIDARNLHGFSILRRNRATGEYICDVPDCPNVAVHVVGVVRELRAFVAVCADHARTFAERS